jgi:WD40 repeat protein
VAFSPDGNTLAAGSFDGMARLWRMPDGEQIRTIAGHTDAVMSVAFSPDGAILATGSLDSSVQFWSAADGSGIAALGGFLTDVLSLDFSPDDSILAAELGNGDIQLLRLDLSSGSQGQFGHSGGSGSAWSQEGDLVESGSTNFFWPIEVSNAGVLHGHTGPANSIAFSPDGEFLASSSGTSVRVWRVADGIPVADLSAHQRAVNEIAYSPDGSLLASAGEDGFIQLWNTADWSLEGSLTSDGEPFTDVAFSPDGKILAAGSRSLESVNNWGNIILWSLSDTSVIKKFRATEVWDIYDLAFSPDSSKLIFSSFNAIVMYSIHDDARVWTVEGEDVSAQPVSVDFLPGGEIVFCADEMAGNLCLFNAASGERIPVLYTKFSETCKAASHKGNLLAAGTPYGFIDLFYIY